MAERRSSTSNRSTMNPKCHLPMLGNGVFTEGVLGFLDKETILMLCQMADVNEMFDLLEHYCVFHGQKFAPPRKQLVGLTRTEKKEFCRGFDSREARKLARSRRTPYRLELWDDSGDESELEEDGRPQDFLGNRGDESEMDSDFLGDGGDASEMDTGAAGAGESNEETTKVDVFKISWKNWLMENPCERSESCLACYIASKALEKCKFCKKYKHWDRFVMCTGCGYRGCEDCGSKVIGACDGCEGDKFCVNCDEDGFVCEYEDCGQFSCGPFCSYVELTATKFAVCV